MQWATLFVLGAATALFHRLTAGAARGACHTRARLPAARAPVAGSLVARYRWPRLVGYLALGVIVGRAGSGWCAPTSRGAALRERCGVTLIAFRAGAGLDLRALVRPQPGLRRALLGTVAGPFLLTALVASS